MEIPTLRRCLRHGLSVENDKSTELVAEAIKAAVAVLNLDDRWVELKDIIPEMLHVSGPLPLEARVSAGKSIPNG
jgi:hypothetical protein